MWFSSRNTAKKAIFGVIKKRCAAESKIEDHLMPDHAGRGDDRAYIKTKRCRIANWISSQ